MNLRPEEREIGKDNYYEALGVTRRDFLQGVVGAGVATGAGLGAMYFGYDKVKNPLRVGVIGTGDEGGVLIGALNPDYVSVVAIADIRPYNVHRAFHGDWSKPETAAIRTGLMAKYGWKTEDEARQHVKVYADDYQELLKDSNVEAVIIALPLHLHHEASLAALKAGKHVLTEKLMAHSVGQCKEMGRIAQETGLYLAVGHQRHYSVLYDNATHLIRWGVLGELHHIRAQWHRGNKPGGDSWSPPLPPFGGESKEENRLFKELNKLLAVRNDTSLSPSDIDLLDKQIAQWEKQLEDSQVLAEQYGYESILMPEGYKRSALEELIRWRLFDRTGGGLMAELGSHQLDAASIFCSALRTVEKNKTLKAHPLTVHAVGGRHIFPPDRDAEDHVYCLFEFPGPGYEPGFDVGYKEASLGIPEKGVPSFEKDPNRKIVVSYSSINGNGFGGYGEVVMGTKGTLILERETELMLYKDAETGTRMSVKGDKGKVAVLDTQQSGPQRAAATAKAAEGPVSKGYTEEIEHWAWCVRNPAPENKPRCHPEVALGDAVIALTAKLAIRRANRDLRQPGSGFVQFREEWFDIENPATPEDDLKT